MFTNKGQNAWALEHSVKYLSTFKNAVLGNGGSVGRLNGDNKLYMIKIVHMFLMIGTI